MAAGSSDFVVGSPAGSDHCPAVPGSASSSDQGPKLFTTDPKEPMCSAEAHLPEAFLDEGRARFAVGDFAAAVAAFSSCLVSDPTASRAYSNRSLAYLRMGNSSKALEDAETCIVLAPSWAKAYYRKATALHESGRLPDAIMACKAGMSQTQQDTELEKFMSKLHGLWIEKAKCFTVVITIAISGTTHSIRALKTSTVDDISLQLHTLVGIKPRCQRLMHSSIPLKHDCPLQSLAVIATFPEILLDLVFIEDPSDQPGPWKRQLGRHERPADSEDNLSESSSSDEQCDEAYEVWKKYGSVPPNTSSRRLEQWKRCARGAPR